MNNKTTSIQRIDWVLEWFATSGLVKNGCDFNFAYKHIVEKHPVLSEEQDWGIELIKILKKLEKDGYIDVIPETQAPPVLGIKIYSHPKLYVISFEGDVFNEQRGYKGEIDKDSLQERRTTQTLTMTKLIAIGVIPPMLYYMVEIIKDFKTTPLSEWIFALACCIGFLSIVR